MTNQFGREGEKKRKKERKKKKKRARNSWTSCKIILALRLKELVSSNGVHVSYSRLYYNVSIYPPEFKEHNNIGESLYGGIAEIPSTSRGF
jgi:hypothetical protein